MADRDAFETTESAERTEFEKQLDERFAAIPTREDVAQIVTRALIEFRDFVATRLDPSVRLPSDEELATRFRVAVGLRPD